MRIAIIAHAIEVAVVFLQPIRDVQAVVTGLADRIAILIGLACVRDVAAVIGEVRNAIVVTIVVELYRLIEPERGIAPAENEA